jgi:hypothetical protein
VIAGYGTASESHRSIGTLREATLVDSKAERHMLVDPTRKGAISASACFGDSGGPVLRRDGAGYALVGVITRANYPRRPIACGFYTRYAPVTARGETAESTSVSADVSSPSPVESPRASRRNSRSKTDSVVHSDPISSFSLVSFSAGSARADAPVKERQRRRRITSR